MRPPGATGNRTHNPLPARAALRPLDYTKLWYMGWNNDTSIGGHNANFNDECNGDCAITDMLNFKMMTECIMCNLIGKDPLKAAQGVQPWVSRV